jgi:hypothetical protein
MIFLFLIVSTSALYAEEQEKKDTQQELLDRIETLEKELKKIEEENKARKSLEVTPVEKTEQGKEVLEAVSREYTLSTKGTLSLDYSIGYAYAPTEAFTIQQQLVDATYSLTANRQANHVITHSIYTSYSILDNLTSSMSIPIVYLYDKMGTTSSLSQTDLGDIGFGLPHPHGNGSNSPVILTTPTAWDARFPQAGVLIRSTPKPNYPRAAERMGYPLAAASINRLIR